MSTLIAVAVFTVVFSDQPFFCLFFLFVANDDNTNFVVFVDIVQNHTLRMKITDDNDDVEGGSSPSFDDLDGIEVSPSNLKETGARICIYTKKMEFHIATVQKL